MELNRRHFLGTALGAAAAPLALNLPARADAGAPAGRATKVAKNLVFMVSDGMSMGTLSLADLFIQSRDNRRSHWVKLLERPGVRRALVDTRSADGFVTDSAAASTAWGTGVLVDNGRIGLTPDGATPVPILMQARQAGKATGLVTTTRVTHATPAGFSCNIPTDREDEGRIAAQLLERRYDLLLGGGRHFFKKELLAKRPDLQVISSRSEFDAFVGAGFGASPVLGLFNNSHMSFEVDRVTDNLGEPSLAEMSGAALRRLDAVGAANGFVLQIEGGRVDHGGHYNDAAGLIYDQVAFDNAVRAVLDWCEGREDTLVILTADHATANPGLTEYGPRGVKSFLRTLEFKHSFEWIERKLDGKFHLSNPEPPEFGGGALAPGAKTEIDADLLHSLVKQATAISLGKGELDLLVRWKHGEPANGFAMAGARYGPIGAVLANHTCVAFLSPNHTSDPVELTALGPGSELMPQRLAINEVHGVMVKALDLPPAKS